VTEIFGPPGSCKSILATKIVASKQQISPELRCAWMAVEPFDPIWAKRFGVDIQKLLMVNPYCAEQVVEITEGLIGSDDCGLVVLDSFAAMVPKDEIGNSKPGSGDLAMIGKRLVHKVLAAQRKAEEQGGAPTFLLTNQVRYRGGMPGGMTTPGGFALKHAAAIRLRLSAKDVFDKTVHTGLPARKEIHVEIERATIPVAARECVFEIAILNHAGLGIGQVGKNWKILASAFPEGLCPA
jgi:recombination protein RecA